MDRLFFLISCIGAWSLSGCKPNQASEKLRDTIINWQRSDPHSYANLSEIHTVHLDLELDVNFDNQTIYGIARHRMSKHQTNRAVFDIKYLDIQRVTIGNDKEHSADYEIGTFDEILGSPLMVTIDSTVEYINIYYKTTAQTEALDWLPAALTEGKQHPFLYSQGQTLLTRTWIPVQDSPANRITYSATVKVPTQLLAVMSATNPVEKSAKGIYHFSMEHAIPSYLIALAVGDLQYRRIGKNCGVYSEPTLLTSCADEFTDVPKMLKIAQKLYGAYRWGQYDILVLPYSFPFGGMENPRLTFAHPSLLTGDHSLMTVIAHELAHSWSGNLLTNATWDDFWLNEGFTVYFENRIMEELYGKQRALMHQRLELQELQHTLKKIDIADTRLKLHLENRNPDEAMTDIAYIKGAFFLRTLEQQVGRKKFDAFLRKYFDQHAFQTITSEQFIEYLNDHLLTVNNIEFNVDEWVYSTGLPANCLHVESERLKKVQKIVQNVVHDRQQIKKITQQKWTTQEWLFFIRLLATQHPSVDLLQKIDATANLRNCGNAEIMCQWYILAIQSGYTDIKSDIYTFLEKMGRLKYLEPIYESMQRSSNKSYRQWGQDTFSALKKKYHPVAQKHLSYILEPPVHQQ